MSRKRGRKSEPANKPGKQKPAKEEAKTATAKRGRPKHSGRQVAKKIKKGLQFRPDFASYYDMYRKAPWLARDAKRVYGKEDELCVVKRNNGEMGDGLTIIHYMVEELPGWEPVYDSVQTDFLIGARHELLGFVTMDAGVGSLEWNSVPTFSLKHMKGDREVVIGTLASIANEFDCAILGVGRQPITRGSPYTLVPKERYDILLDRFGDLFYPMSESTSAQLHVQCFGPEDMIRLMNLLFALSGILTALFANSPIFHGKVQRTSANTGKRYTRPKKLVTFAASRVPMWDDYAPGRVGVPSRPYTDVRDLCTKLWNTEYIIGPNGRGGYQSFGGAPFGDWVGRHRMTMDQFRDHALSHEGSVWEDVRGRLGFGTIEIRMCCQCPPWLAFALEPLIAGIVENQTEVWDYLTRSFSWADLRETQYTSSLFHFRTPIDLGGTEIIDVAKELLPMADKGLRMRGVRGERGLLDVARELVHSRRQPPAIDQIYAFQDGGIKELIEQFEYPAL